MARKKPIHAAATSGMDSTACPKRRWGWSGRSRGLPSSPSMNEENVRWLSTALPTNVQISGER